MSTSPAETARPAAPDVPRPPSAWWRMRWTIRTLFVAITVLALLLAWVGRTIRAVQHRAALAAALELDTPADDPFVAWSAVRAGDSFDPDWPAIFMGDWSSVELTDVDIDYGQTVNDDLLEQIAVFRSLKDVSVSGQQVTDRSFAALREMEKLDTLTIEACDITDETLEHIATLPNLEDLTLRGVAVTDKGFGQIWKLPKLTSLTVEFTLVSPKAIQAFQNDRPGCVVGYIPAAGKPQVEAAKGIMRRDANILYAETRQITALIFDLNKKPWRSQDWALLEAIPEIQAVSIDDLPNPSECIRRVQKLPNVERLVLRQMPVTPGELASLAAFPKLNNLDFQPDNLTDAHLTALGRLQHLRELRIQPDTGTITRRGIESLTQLKQLKLLQLSNVTLLDEDLEALAGLESLATLDLSSTFITDQALDHILKMPQLRELILNETQITGAGAQRIMKAKHIQSATWNDTGIKPEFFVRPAPGDIANP